MTSYVLKFQETNETNEALVGGKGMNLSECAKIQGVRVPAGFSVTTEAYKETVAENHEFKQLLEQLTLQENENTATIREISAKIRTLIQNIPIAPEISVEIDAAIMNIDASAAFAVRSSATAEDLLILPLLGNMILI